VYGDGEQSRDFVYVGNVVQANILAAETKNAPGYAINIGTGNRYTLNQTLSLLEKITGRPAKAKYAASREGDIRDSQADIALAKSVLRYNPRIGFEEGLKETWGWFSASQTVLATRADRIAGQMRQQLGEIVDEQVGRNSASRWLPNP